jgi:hypothetical protein
VSELQDVEASFVAVDAYEFIFLTVKMRKTSLSHLFALQTLQLHVLAKTVFSLLQKRLRETLKSLGGTVKQLSESTVEVEQVVVCCPSSPGHLLS